MIDKGLLWRATTSCLLIFDYFLYVTGNSSLFGGLFWVALLTVAMIVSSYVPLTFRGKEARPFYVLLSIIGVFSIVLYIVSPYTANLVATRMEAQILSFMANPFQNQVEISNEERQLMAKLGTEKYNLRRDAFLPTFRRMDYLLMMKNEEKYLVILRMSWMGTPVISVRRIDS